MTCPALIALASFGCYFGCSSQRLRSWWIFSSTGGTSQCQDLKFQEEFCERSELFVMSVLYRPGNGNLFCQCHKTMHFSITEMNTFVKIFTNTIVDTKDKYVYLPRNLTKLSNCPKIMEKLVCPVAADLWTLSMLSGVLVRWGIIIAQRVNQLSDYCIWMYNKFQSLDNWNLRTTVRNSEWLGDRQGRP